MVFPVSCSRSRSGAPRRPLPLLSLGLGALGVLTCLHSACLPPQESSTCGSQESPTRVDGGLRCSEPFELGQPGGTPARFAVKVVQYLHMSSAGLVETDTLGWAIGWADFVPTQSQIEGRMDLKLCHLEVPKIQIPGQPVASSLELLPSTLDYVPPAPAAYWLDGTRTCDGFRTDPSVALLAARLVDDLLDPLPWDAQTQTCPNDLATNCLFDQDLDGKPAVTFLARNFPALPVDEIYATLRSWVRMDGMAATPDMFLGTATFGMEISVVGCRIEPLGGGERRTCNADETDVIAQITPTITQNPNMDSTFLAVRVSSDTDCLEVIEKSDWLFGR